MPVPSHGAGHLGTGRQSRCVHRSSACWAAIYGPSRRPGIRKVSSSTLPAIATVLIGILAGEWLRSGGNDAGRGARKVVGLLAAGGALMLAGHMLDPYFPINKNLWTSTYVLFTGGFAMLLLALCYWAVDLRRWRKWAAPFLVFGTNSILAFSLALLIAIMGETFWTSRSSMAKLRTRHDWIYNSFFSPYASPKKRFPGLSRCAFVLLIFGLLWPLYRRKVFVRV